MEAIIKTRNLLGKQVGEIGFGCMNFSHAYSGKLSENDAIDLLHKAYDLGVDHFDTAALYGFGENERIVGKGIKPFRDKILLASKCGMTGVNGKRTIDGSPKAIEATLNNALKSLQTDFIDLYYLHRIDPNVPVEDSVGALANAVKAGKIGAIGLSEASAETLVRAHAIHPIAAMQTEYSLWTRNAEIAVLKKCEELDVAFVGFSPLARGYLSNTFAHIDDLDSGDIRRGMPRFQGENWMQNRRIFTQFAALANEAECTPAQLAIHWVLKQADYIHALPGTRFITHLEENLRASELTIDSNILVRAGQLINQETVQGPRYPAAAQADIDTEEF